MFAKDEEGLTGTNRRDGFKQKVIKVSTESRNQVSKEFSPESIFFAKEETESIAN